MPASKPLNRRQFIKRLAVVGAVALTPVLLPACHASENWQYADLASNIVPGKVKGYQLAKNPVFLTRTAGGKILALSAICTHRGCPVAWFPKQSEFVCPCHGGKYAANGANISGPPPSPLPVLETKIQDGKVLVKLTA